MTSKKPPQPPHLRVHLSLEAYVKFALSTRVYRKRITDPDGRRMYIALGLAGEAGEVAEKVKKFYRDGGRAKGTRRAIKKELGDLLWYVVTCADEWGLTLQEVMAGNVRKLSRRRRRGTLHGSGDNR